MDFTTRKRVAGIGLAASLLVGACGSSGGAASQPVGASAVPGSSAAAASPATSASPATAGSTGAAAGGELVPPSAEIALQGAGATFPAPLYQKWFEDFSGKYSNVKVDYQAIGSGGGIKAFTEQTVDFGASDAAMKDDEIAKLPAGATPLHIPTALGAVVVTYNLPGVAELKLDAANIAGIFLGTITTWNDPAIAGNNSGATLPNTPITVVHRSDGSGTTNAFTTYLATVSPDWKTKVGAGKEVNWPTGIGAQGNDGVAGGVKQTEGAVGYVELNYATQAQLTTAKVKNADGAFVAASVDGVVAAADAAAAQMPADLRQPPIINGPGASTYPIASYTYLLVYQDQKDVTKGKALISLISWALTDGQDEESTLGYAPLPQPVQEKAMTMLHSVTAGGEPIWP